MAAKRLFLILRPNTGGSVTEFGPNTGGSETSVPDIKTQHGPRVGALRNLVHARLVYGRSGGRETSVPDIKAQHGLGALRNLVDGSLRDRIWSTLGWSTVGRSECHPKDKVSCDRRSQSNRCRKDVPSHWEHLRAIF